MKLTLIDKEQFVKETCDIWDINDASSDSIAEAIRSELSARTVCSQSVLVQSVFKFYSLFADVDLEAINQTLKALDLNGDISLGPNGMVASTPLRFIRIKSGNYKLVGSLPSWELSRQIEFDGLSKGVVRSVFVNNDERFSTHVEKIKGVILTPERWAGLEKSLSAREKWLKWLEMKIKNDSQPAGNLALESGKYWQVYNPLSGSGLDHRNQWKKDTNGSLLKLWRTRNDYNQWVFVWSEGGNPESTSFVRITNDDAIRTMYSLDSIEGGSAPVSARAVESFVHMETSCIFPRPEYRYLTTMGERLNDTETGYVYSFEDEIWPDVKKIIEKRLQVKIEMIST